MRWLLKLTTGCLIFLCLAGGGIADLPDKYPALFDVTGVADDDVLNIRAEPNPASDIIGNLPPDRTDVEVLRLSGDRKWARIGMSEKSGWVSVAYLAPQPPQPDNVIPTRLRCSGTEPFWSLHIPSDDLAEFEQMPDPIQSFSVAWQSPPAGRTDREMAAILSGDEGSARVFLNRELCSDGMSDREYGFALRLILETAETPIFFSGCCSLHGP